MVPPHAAAYDAAYGSTGSALRPAAVSHGVALTFETFDGVGADEAPLRVRPAEDILLRVIDGLVRVTVAGDDRVMGSGDEVIIPAGAAHRLAGVAGRGRVVMGFRPA